MKTKRAKDREIYDNYYVFEAWESAARENLEERGIADPSEEEMWNEVNALDQDFWEDVKCEMTNFFDDGSAWILSGTMERWNGKHSGHILFHTFSELLTKTAKDCDYYRFPIRTAIFSSSAVIMMAPTVLKSGKSQKPGKRTTKTGRTVPARATTVPSGMSANRS